MFRVQDFTELGERVGYSEPGDVHDAVTPPPAGVIRWIDLQDQDAESLELLRARFDFHPLAIEDCSHLDQRPKLEEYGEVLFVVTHGFCCGAERAVALEPLELHAFLGTNFLVTVHQAPVPELEAAWRRVVQKPALARRGADFLYHLVADAMVDANFPFIDKITDELESLTEEVLHEPRREHLARIFALKKELATMRSVLAPQREVATALAKLGDEDDGAISERNSAYFRDMYDHLVRIVEAIDANRELLKNGTDAYLSAVSNRTNEVMKYLTLMSAVFLPLSFVVGFFGQNFDDLPFASGWNHSHGAMVVMIGLCFAIPVVMLAWFRAKRWL